MRKSRLKGVLAMTSAIACLVPGIIALNTLEHMSEKTPEGAGTVSVPISRESRAAKYVTVGGEEHRLDPDISTILLIGTDDMEQEQHEGHRSQAMADYLALAILNSREKTCTILQIDRNTMAEVPVLGSNGKSIGTTTHQICYAHSYGEGVKQGCENTVNAVSRLLCGVPIDNYLSLTMGAIPILNDTVGGVTVTIEDDFTGIDDTLVQGEAVHLMGDHAYNFVHERMRMPGDDSNTSRMRRQSVYAAALAEAIRKKMDADDGFALTLFSAVADYLVTDCAIDELSKLSGDLDAYTLEGFMSIEGENVKKELIEFYPDEEELKELVVELFCVPVEE